MQRGQSEVVPSGGQCLPFSPANWIRFCMNWLLLSKAAQKMTWDTFRHRCRPSFHPALSLFYCTLPDLSREKTNVRWLLAQWLLSPASAVSTGRDSECRGNGKKAAAAAVVVVAVVNKKQKSKEEPILESWSSKCKQLPTMVLSTLSPFVIVASDRQEKRKEMRRY